MAQVFSSASNNFTLPGLKSQSNPFSGGLMGQALQSKTTPQPTNVLNTLPKGNMSAPPNMSTATNKQDIKSQVHSADGTIQTTYHPSVDQQREGLLAQLATANQQLKEAQAVKSAGYADGETPQKDAQGNIINKNATFAGGNQNLSNSSGNAVTSGQQNIQKGTESLTNVASNPQQAASGFQNTLSNISTQGTPEVTKANEQYNQFAKSSPLLLADVANNPNVAAEVSVGRGAQLGQILAGEQNALATGVANAYTGQGQKITAANEGAGNALTGQGQGITAGTNILNAGISEQGQGITGLGTATGYAQPQLGTPGQALYSPYGGSTGGLTSDMIDQYAKLYTTGEQGAIPSSITGNPVLNAQLLARAKQINPNFNVNEVAGIQSGQQAQAGQVQQYTSALQQGQNLQAQFKDLLATFGLNPSDVNVANVALQKIAANTSDPKYKILQNYVTDIANTYAQILTPPGGSVTDTSRGMATGMLDATAKGSSLIDVMQTLDEQAKAKIAGTPTYGGNTGSTSASTGGGLYSF